MGEGGGGSRVSQIVSGHVDGLDGGNGTLGGGGNTLLHDTHVDGEGGLVTDSRGNTTEKSGHLRTGLGETENVVNEEQHVLTLLVSEIFSHGPDLCQYVFSNLRSK
jgi:peptide chain release factor 1